MVTISEMVTRPKLVSQERNGAETKLTINKQYPIGSHCRVSSKNLCQKGFCLRSHCCQIEVLVAAAAEVVLAN